MTGFDHYGGMAAVKAVHRKMQRSLNQAAAVFR